MGDTYSTRGQDLRGQEPPSSFLAEIDYRDCNLRNTELANITLHLADLRNADFREAFLEDADLRYADLRRADLRGAQLYGARLFGADLRGARLKGADLVNVDLRNTRLEETDLAWCDLEFGADLEGASFDGTRLAIVNLNQAGAFDRLCAIARSCNARRDYSREPADAGFRWMSGDTAVSRSEYEAERCEDEDAERCEDENGFAIVRGDISEEWGPGVHRNRLDDPVTLAVLRRDSSRQPRYVHVEPCNASLVMPLEQTKMARADSGIDMSGRSLKGIRLSGVDFRYANLRGADLREARLGWCLSSPCRSSRNESRAGGPSTYRFTTRQPPWRQRL